IGTIFTEPSAAAATGTEDNNKSSLRPNLLTRAVKLIRPSFASLQLICSDFLPSLPNACFLNLVDTLYKFCTQDDELNVALTVGDDSVLSTGELTLTLADCHVFLGYLGFPFRQQQVDV